MKTVAALIADLSKFPLDAHCYAYEGEIVGIVICKSDVELGYIAATSGDEADSIVVFSHTQN